MPGLQAGSLFGHYYLRRLLGHGSTGEVYEAVDTVKERTVAVKLLSPLLSRDPAFRERLQREVHTAGRFQGPHMVPINDYGEIDGRLFVDMRLIEGADLSALLRQDGALPPARAVNIVRQAASALDAAHAAGMIHHGVKPENILLTENDFVYLADFGITSTTTGAEVGIGIDVYALTCVLYECLTGSPLYSADTTTMLGTKPIPRPSQSGTEIPAAFDAVIAKGMAEDATERYSSAGELASAAYRALSGADQRRTDESAELSQKSAPPAVTCPGHVSTLPKLRPRLRIRKQMLRPGVAALAVLLAVGLIWLTHRSHPEQPVADTATTESAPAPNTPAPTLTPAQAQARLFELLPAGYPPGACKPATPLAGAVAEMSCGENTDPGGPASATYTLFPDAGAQHVSFDTTVQTSSVVNCPGRIQSPGPWHRAATPDKPSGLLLCATRQNHPTVVWTNDADLLVNVIRADRSGVTFEQLYSWWSLHS